MTTPIGVALTIALASLWSCAPVSPPGPSSDAANIGALPNSPAAKRLSEWVTAYNTGSLDSLTAFAATSFSRAALAKRNAADRAASDKWLYLNLGPMIVQAVDSSNDSSIAATVWQDLVEGWGHVTIATETTYPFGITSRQVSFFEPASSSVQVHANVTETQIASELTRFIPKLVRADVFSGVVSVYHQGRPVFGGAYGLARKDPDIPNAIDTRFEMASVSKMFTGVAIAQLVQRGILSYQDTIAKLLPDYPNRSVAARLTVHHLLTHTSGLPEYLFTEAYRVRRSRVRSPVDYWPFFGNDTLEFAPGSQWSYSSSNYVLLGAIIERVSGMSFVTYVQSHIFTPLGMTHTSYELNGDSAATAFTRFGADRRPDLDRYHSVERSADGRGSPAGGSFSTAPDLQRFGNGLLLGKLVSDKTLREAITPRIKAEDGTWSYGFESHEWNGVRFFGHNGFAGGAFNQVDIYPDLGYTVVVLSNVDMSGAGAIAYKMRLLLTQR
ncbi:MAG: serine hydrolase domain-containing protein [Gemmatimonadaceae bacterium]